ncbi:MAG: hypothetical protein HZA52_17945 [Planctomycetes bacterium]|nr:hypothetical protein [Planctomycetota bacterium]
MHKYGSRALVALALAAVGATATAQGWQVELALDAAAHGLTLDPFVAINDHGALGFAAVGPQGSAGYLLLGNSLVVAAPPIGGRQYLGAGLDDASPPQLITRDRDTGSPPIFRVRLWSGDGSGANTLLGNSTADFDSASSWVDLNASGIPAFTALINGSSQTALMSGTQKPPTTLAQYSGNQSLRPEISNDHQIVIKDNLGVILWPYPSGSSTFIAGFGDGFLGLGNYPGISSNGNAVAFSGDRGNGEGAFASVRTPSGRHLFALAGDGSGDGFTDIDGGQRIAVAAFGASTYQTVLSVFSGTRNGVVGVWASRVLVSDTSSGFQVTPLGLDLVAKVGDVIGGKTLSSWNLYHALNRHGQLAFSAVFSDGTQGIVRGEGDLDGDSLLDIWETQGIDADGDGVVDLDLPALGANPLHKDIFVEIDAMAGREPTQATLDRVKDAFEFALTVDNPDGNLGITLHALLDEIDIPFASWNTLGASGFPTDFDTVKASRFGTPTERSSPDAATLLDAKKMAYHYCIFADRFDAAGHGGIAELPGNDFAVTLGTYATPGGTPDEQAGTFMHELGHNLGLRHGGADDINYKPNYPSVMNYLWAVPTGSPPGWFLKYCAIQYPTLNEADSSELVGIGARPGFTTWIGPASTLAAVPENGPVDFDGDHLAVDPHVARDVSQIVASDPPSPGQLLVSHDDWTNLVYDFRSTADYGDGQHPNNTGQIEIDPAIIAELVALRPGPAVYCSAKVNSLGCTPALDWTGTASLSGPDDFFLSASNVRNQKPGLLVWSAVPDAQPFFGGVLCVQVPMLRKPVFSSGGSAAGDDCSGAYSAHFDQAYMAGQSLQAGDTVCAQFWSRDTSASDPIGIGLTAAITFSIAP